MYDDPSVSIASSGSETPSSLDLTDGVQGQEEEENEPQDPARENGENGERLATDKGDS